MKLVKELTLILLVFFSEGSCQLQDNRIHFLDENASKPNEDERSTVRETEAPSTTTEFWRIESWPSKSVELELDAEIERACHQSFSQPEPRFNPDMPINERKCKEYEYGVDKQLFSERASRECIFAMGNRGWHFVLSGELTEPGEFPHMAAIGWANVDGGFTFKCGGSLISSRHILTAAHCLVSGQRDPSLVTQTPTMVRLGDQNLLDKPIRGFPPQDYKISKLIKHPLYKSPSKYNDVAILELEKDVPFDKHVRPACLWNRNELNVTSGVITGWGVTRVGDLNTSPDLLKATVDVFENRHCDRLLRRHRNRHWRGVADTQVCAGLLKGGTDTCQGDSGGPIQHKHESKPLYHVFGITSFGFMCGNANTPGVYTRVSEYVPWIESVVWPTT